MPPIVCLHGDTNVLSDSFKTDVAVLSMLVA
jgi:hypothetical protein